MCKHNYIPFVSWLFHWETKQFSKSVRIVIDYADTVSV